MKLLFENWRKFVNEVEGKQLPLPGMEGELETVEDVAEQNGLHPKIAKKLLELKEGGVGVGIDIGGDDAVTFFYDIEHEDHARPSTHNRVVFSRDYDCAPHVGMIWTIDITNARDKPGMGPVLYEAALETASELDNGLAPDRNTVSQYAQMVWDAYTDIRDDVEKKQLDLDKYDTETPSGYEGGEEDIEDAKEKCVEEHETYHDWTIDAEEYFNKEDYMDEDGEFDEYKWDQDVQEKADEMEKEYKEEHCEDYDGYSQYLDASDNLDRLQLNDDPGDDCSQTSALYHAFEDYGDVDEWNEMAVSRAYYKPGAPMLRWLKKNNMLLFTDEELEL